MVAAEKRTTTTTATHAVVHQTSDTVHARGEARQPRLLSFILPRCLLTRRRAPPSSRRDLDQVVLIGLWLRATGWQFVRESLIGNAIGDRGASRRLWGNGTCERHPVVEMGGEVHFRIGQQQIPLRCFPWMRVSTYVTRRGPCRQGFPPPLAPPASVRCSRSPSPAGAGVGSGGAVCGLGAAWPLGGSVRRRIFGTVVLDCAPSPVVNAQRKCGAPNQESCCSSSCSWPGRNGRSRSEDARIESAYFFRCASDTFGTLATTLTCGSTSSAMSYFNTAPRNSATSLSVIR